MKTIVLSMLILLGGLSLKSQTNPDSLQQVLQKTVANRDNLQHYLNKMETSPPGEIEKIRLIGNWVITHTDKDSLFAMHATANYLLGLAYTNTSRYAEATQYLTKAQAIAQKNDLHTLEAKVLNTLGAIYKSNEQYEKAMDYFKQSLAVSSEYNFEHGKARALYNIGTTNLRIKPGIDHNIRFAIASMLQGLHIVEKIQDTPSIITQSRGLAGAYALLKDYDSALTLMNHAEALMKRAASEMAFLLHYRQLAKIYNDKKAYPEALRYYEKGLQFARKFDVPRLMCMYYAGLAETYENAGNYKKANEYNQLNGKMHDALVSKENFVAAADIRNSYERLQKDNELLRLAAVNKRRSAVNNLLVVASVGLLLAGFFGYKYFNSRTKILRQEKEIQEEKIARLEKDKQLLAIDAMLKGQEDERSRIAKDLHDGLGGMLSGTKLSFMNLRQRINLTSENKALFDKSLSMLDNTIGDLRKVAQNLMPEALVKFGLREALSDFCEMIQASSGIKMICQHYGQTSKVTNTAEIFIYRIIQELVNNALKHASASQIMVQLTMNADKVGITVEDDGIGFDKNVLSRLKGAGFTNINYRVQYFRGSTDIVTSPGNGTSINIQLNV